MRSSGQFVRTTLTRLVITIGGFIAVEINLETPPSKSESRVSGYVTIRLLHAGNRSAQYFIRSSSNNDLSLVYYFEVHDIAKIQSRDEISNVSRRSKIFEDLGYIEILL